MRKWKQAVLTGDITEMDHLIISREIELKGRERAKLQNSKVYHWQEGTWLGAVDCSIDLAMYVRCLRTFSMGWDWAVIRMFRSAQDRLDYGEILRPPAGFVCEIAVGTTYSLDLETMLGCPWLCSSGKKWTKIC